MPDLTIVTMQKCKQNKRYSIGGYKQVYISGFEFYCSCKGYKFRKKCKHLSQIETNLCHYHEQIDGSPEIDGICPLCGNKTEYVKVGV